MLSQNGRFWQCLVQLSKRTVDLCSTPAILHTCCSVSLVTLKLSSSRTSNNYQTITLRQHIFSNSPSPSYFLLTPSLLALPLFTPSLLTPPSSPTCAPIMCITYRLMDLLPLPLSPRRRAWQPGSTRARHRRVVCSMTRLHSTKLGTVARLPWDGTK